MSKHIYYVSRQATTADEPTPGYYFWIDWREAVRGPYPTIERAREAYAAVERAVADAKAGGAS